MSVSNDMEKVKLLYTAFGNIKWCSCFREHFDSSLKS